MVVGFKMRDSVLTLNVSRSVLHSDYATALAWHGAKDLVTGGFDNKLHKVRIHASSI